MKPICFFLSILLSLISIHAAAELMSTGVGMIRGQAVTSREVQIQNLLEATVTSPGTLSKVRLLTVDSKAFGKAVQETLLETVVALEAQNFNLVQLSADEVDHAVKTAGASLKSVSAWKDLQVTGAELELGLRRKLQAKKFIQFRAQSSVLPVTDMEAEKYFNENRLKFGNLPFANFKENIKSFLSRNQVDRRLKDWYEVLLSKYQVKNLIAEI